MSSTDDSLSPDDKKLRQDASLPDSELCESRRSVNYPEYGGGGYPENRTSVGKTWKIGTVCKSGWRKSE